jgi:hypothetical protein
MGTFLKSFDKTGAPRLTREGGQRMVLREDVKLEILTSIFGVPRLFALGDQT